VRVREVREPDPATHARDDEPSERSTGGCVAGYGPSIATSGGSPGIRPARGARTVQETVRTALTTIVFAKTSWKPCLVGLE
jgi:hypothetical protein